MSSRLGKIARNIKSLRLHYQKLEGLDILMRRVRSIITDQEGRATIQFALGDARDALEAVTVSFGNGPELSASWEAWGAEKAEIESGST